MEICGKLGETAMMVAELQRAVRANASSLHDLAVSDRVLVAVFALVIFALTFVNVLIELDTH